MLQAGIFIGKTLHTLAQSHRGLPALYAAGGLVDKVVGAIT